eukprot:944401-Amphidinium_carterae.1
MSMYEYQGWHEHEVFSVSNIITKDGKRVFARRTPWKLTRTASERTQQSKNDTTAGSRRLAGSTNHGVQTFFPEWHQASCAILRPRRMQEPISDHKRASLLLLRLLQCKDHLWNGLNYWEHCVGLLRANSKNVLHESKAKAMNAGFSGIQKV